MVRRASSARRKRHRSRILAPSKAEDKAGSGWGTGRRPFSFSADQFGRRDAVAHLGAVAVELGMGFVCLAPVGGLFMGEGGPA